MLERTIKIGLASMLLAVLMVVGGISVSGIAGQSTNLLTTAQPAAQTSVSAAANTTAPAPVNSAVQTSGAQAPQQALGIVDARTAVQHTGPAVVTVVNNLAVQSRNGFGGTGGQAPMASGSGVIIDKSGYIVTNNHVVEGQKSLQVIFSDGKKSSATLVGTDQFSDLAVIKVDAVMPLVATFGNSDRLEPGQPVVAIGSALGDYQNTVTAGIVSALHRDIVDANAPALRNLIQTDAAINHGNSGGPLLDLEGNVIGINTAVVRSTGLGGDVAEGLGFAIPSNTVREVSSQLIKNGSVSRPYIGISYQVITPQVAGLYNLARDKGILVMSVEPNSPAAKAGIEENSIITKFDGVELNSDNSLLELLMKHKIGDTVKLTALNQGATAEKDYSVTLTQRPNGQ